jgi:hypothetical protein
MTVWKCIPDLLPALNFLMFRTIHDHDQGETNKGKGQRSLIQNHVHSIPANFTTTTTMSHLIATCAIRDAEVDENQ